MCSNGSARNTKVIRNQILIAKYARINNHSIDKLQKAGISEEINTNSIELAARRIQTACQTTHVSKTSTELLMGGFYGQLRLLKMPNYGPANPANSAAPSNLTPLKPTQSFTLSMAAV